jgi:hypothetical protein
MMNPMIRFVHIVMAFMVEEEYGIGLDVEYDLIQALL